MPPKTRQQVKADQAAQGTSGGNKSSIWRSEEEVLMMNFGKEEGIGETNTWSLDLVKRKLAEAQPDDTISMLASGAFNLCQQKDS